MMAGPQVPAIISIASLFWACQDSKGLSINLSGLPGDPGGAFVGNSRKDEYIYVADRLCIAFCIIALGLSLALAAANSKANRVDENVPDGTRIQTSAKAE